MGKTAKPSGFRFEEQEGCFVEASPWDSFHLPRRENGRRSLF
jgi:hypothetical protein